MSPALAVRGTGKFGWGSLLASGDFDFITSASFTTQASVSIDNCFSAGYDHYLIKRNLLGSLGVNAIHVRLRASSTDASGADYRAQSMSANGGSVGGARTTGETLWNAYIGGYTEATTFGFSNLWISNPFAAVRTTAASNFSYEATGSIFLFSSVAEHDQATSYDGMTIIPQFGTITGSIYVYGLAV